MNPVPDNTFSQGRTGRLVRVLSAHGVEMSGFHADAAPDAPLLLCVPGLSGNLDTSFVFDLLAQASLAPCHILTVGTSAQGNISLARAGEPLGYRLGGSAFERFEDCVPDLAAWLDYAATHTRGPVIVLGHSLGASKCVQYLASTRDERVCGVILASAPDLTGAFLARHGQAAVTAFLAEARQHVDRGAGRTLMGEDCVIGLLQQRVSAQTLLDRFAQDALADTFDFFARQSPQAFRALAQVTVPILAIYGQHQEIVGPGGVDHALQQLRTHAQGAPSFTGVVVPGNHWYQGAEQELAVAISTWMQTCGLMPDALGVRA